MYKAFGIVSSSGRNIYVDGMQDYRPIGAFSFLGRYRVIDFPISNMTNSNIERIQVYINNKPRSVVEEGAVVQRSLVADGIRIGKGAVVGDPDSEHIELVAKRVKGAE